MEGIALLSNTNLLCRSKISCLFNISMLSAKLPFIEKQIVSTQCSIRKIVVILLESAFKM